jgi:uncharacterized Fe-S cluster protein YjdI
MTSEEQQQQKSPQSSNQRTYRTDKIVVYWNPGVCINSHKCVNGLPQVFRPQDRPWIHVDAASADEIAEVITRCPSGALHYERLDGGAQEVVSEEFTIEPQPNGPLYVRGLVRIMKDDGTLLREDSRMALCRCGQSHKKPFCDGTHRTVGFEAD